MIPGEARHFSIHNHASQAFQAMSELRKKQELCDIVISVEGRKFHAHKVVLAGCSPYLRAMFTNGMRETEKNMVEIHGIEPETMNMLLDFVYNGAVMVTTENVQLLLQGASMLNLASLRNVCCNFLEQHLDASNCLGIQSFADMFSCLELEEAARRYVYQHFLEVVRHDEFLQLSETRLVELLQSDQLQVTSEEQVFNAAVQWIDWDPVKRNGDAACRVMQHVRLALLDTSWIEKVLQADFIRSCEKCQNLVALATRAKEDNNVLASISNRAQPLGIFVIGGRNGTDSQLRSMEHYDFLRDQWIPMSNMSVARTAISATSLGGVLWTVGGECALAEPNDDTLYLRCLEQYDPVLKEWTKCADMKVPRSFLAAAALGGYLYALGGEDRTNSYNIAERYDPKSDSWSFVPSMRQKRAGAGVTVCDGKIYIAGGHDKNFNTDRASVECYDQETCEWSFVAEMENPRSGLVLVAVDHFLYAIGGRSRFHQYFSLGERYNLLTNQWMSISSMECPRAWPAVAVIDKKIYVMGGFDGISRLRSVEVYDPELDQWTFLNNMNVSRAGCAAAVL